MRIADLPACPIFSKMKQDGRKLADNLVKLSRDELAKPNLLQVERDWHEARIARLTA